LTHYLKLQVKYFNTDKNSLWKGAHRKRRKPGALCWAAAALTASVMSGYHSIFFPGTAQNRSVFSLKTNELLLAPVASFKKLYEMNIRCLM